MTKQLEHGYIETKNEYHPFGGHKIQEIFFEIFTWVQSNKEKVTFTANAITVTLEPEKK